MSEILSAVVCDPRDDIKKILSSVKFESLLVQVQDATSAGPFEAPYLPALWNRLKQEERVVALIILGRTSQGYLTNSLFLPLHGPIGAEVAHIKFEGAYRRDFEKLLRLSLDSSVTSEVLILAESTYSLSSSSRQPLERYELFSVSERVTADDFLRMLDENELQEAVIYQITA